MGYLEMLEKNRKSGYVMYWNCGHYQKQSDPQDFSIGKTIVIDTVSCPECIKKNEEEVKEAQALCGRLGIPKENSDEV